MNRLAIASATLFMFGMSGTRARALDEPPPAEACASRRHISVAFDAALDPVLEQETMRDLESELAPRGLTACPATESTSGAALAEVRIEARGPQRIAIDVFDRTTDKRVGRDLSLARIRDNARALAIAIAIDELLRASWAELALRADVAPPVPSARVAAPTPASTRERKVALGLGFESTYARSFEHYDAFGATTILDALAFRSLWLEARAGFTRALKHSVREGAIDIMGPSVALSVGACRELAATSLRLCLGARTTADVLTFTGESPAVGSGRSSVKSVVTQAVVGHARLKVWRDLSVAMGLGAGTPLVGARVTNGTRTLSRIEGLLLQGSLGLAVEL